MSIAHRLVGALAAVACPFAFATTYAVTDLGGGEAVALNDLGVATFQATTDYVHWYCWTVADGVRTQLPIAGERCMPAGINNAGAVVGNLGLDITDLGTAFTFVDGKYTDLGLGPFPGATWSEATAVNDAGHVVGDSGDTTTRHGVLSTGKARRVLPMPDPQWIRMYTTDVNAADEVTGGVENAAGQRHAFLFSGGASTDLGTLDPTNPAAKSWGARVNASGQVAGWSDTPAGGHHAILVDQGTMHDLGVLHEKDVSATSEATGINAAGTVVGFSVSHRKSLAFTWTSGHAMRSIDSQLSTADQALWNVYKAQAINESGAILAWAWYVPDGSYVHGVLLTPLD